MVGHALVGGCYHSISLSIPSRGKLDDLGRFLTLLATGSLISICILLYDGNF